MRQPLPLVILLLGGLTLFSALHSQIPGTHAHSALIYQDQFTSGLAQVLSYDLTTQGSPNPGSPPPVTYHVTAATGSFSTGLNAPPRTNHALANVGTKAKPQSVVFTRCQSGSADQ